MQTQLRQFKCNIDDYEAEFQLTGKDKDLTFNLKLTSNANGSMREAKYTIDNIPQKIKDFYQEWPVLETLFQEIYREKDNGALKITEEKEFIFTKKLIIKEKASLKKFVLETREKVVSQKQILLNLQKKMREIQKWMQKSDKKSLDQIYQRLEKLEKNKIEEKQNGKIVEINQAKIENLEYRFSETQKGSKTVVYQKGRFCENKVTGHQNVFVENSCGRRRQKISFKIKKLVYWIGFGFGLKNQLQANNYVSHGTKISYLIATGGQFYQVNNADMSHTLKLATGDIIDIKLMEDTIAFSKRGQSVGVILNVELNEQQWKNTCFFVNVHTEGDCVEILP